MKMQHKQHPRTKTWAGFALASIALAAVTPLKGQSLFFEDFEDVKLGFSFDEAAGYPVFSEKGPEGWSIVNDEVLIGTDDEGNIVPRPLNGVYEWAGWSWANKDWWVNVAGDQNRSQFTRASGTVMIADPDEWDDQDHPATGDDGFGWYKTDVTSPTIDVSGQDADSLVLLFDSSWRPEFDGNFHQSGRVTVSFDGGAGDEILTWLSDPDDDNFKADATNELVILPLSNPASASDLSITFGMFDAGNDWWWAVDNVQVAVPPAVTGVAGGVNEFRLNILEALGKTVNKDTLSLTLDGDPITATSVTDNDLGGGNNEVAVVYNIAPDFWPSDSTHTVGYAFTTGDGRDISGEVSFTVQSFVTVGPEHKLANVDTGTEGFIMHVRQADQGLATSIAVREQHLADQILDATGAPLENLAWGDDPGFDQPAGTEFVWLPPVINMEQNGTAAGAWQEGDGFPDDYIPGIPGFAQADTDNITAEIVTAVRIPDPGIYVFGFNSDDGFKTSAGIINDVERNLTLGLFDGGRGASTTEYTVFFPEAGDYQMRSLWFEGGGGANLEWFTISPTRALLGDTANGGLQVFAYRAPAPLAVTSISPANGTGGASLTPTVSITVEDGGTTLDAGSVSMTFDGADVTPNVSGTGTTTISYEVTEELGLNTEHTFTVTFSDSDGAERTVSSTFTTQRDDLLAYWDFNDGSNPAVSLDYVASHVGDLVEGAGYSADAEGFTGAAGDTALWLGEDDSAQRMLVEADWFNAATAQDSMTVSFWQKWHTEEVFNSSSFWFLSPTTGSGYRGAQGHTPWSNGSVYFDTAGCCDGATQRINAPITNAADPFAWNEWHHFVFVKSGSDKKIYVDGALFHEGVNTGALPTDVVQLVVGGQSYDAGSTDGSHFRSMRGWIDDFAVFSAGLNEEDVMQLFQGAKPYDVRPPAISHGPFTEPTVVNMGDLSGEVSYEFVFNAVKAGASTAIAGNDAWAFKLDQWNEQGIFGTTQFGVADNVFTPVEGQNVNSVFGRLVHVVLVSGSGESLLYINGVLSGTWAGDIVFSGDTKVMGARLEQATDHMGEGSVMERWDSYDRALSAEEIADLASMWPTGGGEGGGIVSIGLSGGDVVIEYTGTLQSSSSVSGPYTPVDGATSPYSTAPTEDALFFIAD